MKAQWIAVVIAMSALGLWLGSGRRDRSPCPEQIPAVAAMPARAPEAMARGSKREASLLAHPSWAWNERRLHRGEPVLPDIETRNPENLVHDPEPQSPGFLAKMGTRALNDPEPSVREQAVAQLCGSHEEEAVPFLTAALRDPEPRIWQQTLAGLRLCADRVSLQALVEIMADDPQRRPRQPHVRGVPLLRSGYDRGRGARGK